MRRGGLPWLVAMSLLAWSCTSSDSGPSETPMRLASKVVFEGNRPVATFMFEQFEDGRITLKIENANNEGRTVTFTYDVKFTPRQTGPDVLPWATQGSVLELMPGQLTDKGVVANNLAPIDDGRIDIAFLGRVTFQ